MRLNRRRSCRRVPEGTEAHKAALSKRASASPDLETRGGRQLPAAPMAKKPKRWLCRSLQGGRAAPRLQVSSWVLHEMAYNQCENVNPNRSSLSTRLELEVNDVTSTVRLRNGTTSSDR